MSVERTELKQIEMDGYVLLARPCVNITEQSARQLAEEAASKQLDFVGVVSGRVDVIGRVDYNTVMDLSQNPVMSILIRNICAGVYSRKFLDEHGIELRMNDDTIFPDLDILWQTFVYSQQAMLVSVEVCDSVGSDTVWIDEAAPAFDVNRRYDLVKDILMNDWDLWQKWKAYYSLQRFRCYFEMLHWMTEEVGWVFAERMVVDFHRSLELDEIDPAMFSAEERTALYVLDRDPGFLKRFYLGKVILNKKIYDQKGQLQREEMLQSEQARRIAELTQSVKQKDGRIGELDRQLKELDAQQKAAEERFRQDIENLEAEHRQKLADELDRQKMTYETSTTFRAGKVIMACPIAIKKLVKKILRR